MLDQVDDYINYRAGKKLLQKKLEETEREFWEEYKSKKLALAE